MRQWLACACFVLAEFCALPLLGGSGTVGDWAQKDGELIVEHPDGRILSMGQIAPGQPVVLAVIKAHWCLVCQSQLADLNRQLAKFEKLGAVVGGLSSETQKVNRGLSEYLGLNFDMIGTPKDTLHRLGFLTVGGAILPGFIILDACGNVASIIKGRQPGQKQTQSVLRLAEKISREAANCSLML
jgi:peroxiredoxin